MRERKWVQDELRHPETVSRGTRGMGVRRIQEHLSLNGFTTAIDGLFGPATEGAVARFQSDRALPASGRVTRRTWLHLTQQLRRALGPLMLPNTIGFRERVQHFARIHVDQHPREVGGDNRGPWVRLYMQGKDEYVAPKWPWPWCLGWVSFILHQAAASQFADPPFPYRVSCDLFAQDALDDGTFVDGTDPAFREALDAPCVFLLRKDWGDWIHAGIVTSLEDEYFHTVEGNSNQAGSRNGYEVCRRVRAYERADFVHLPRHLDSYEPTDAMGHA